MVASVETVSAKEDELLASEAALDRLTEKLPENSEKPTVSEAALASVKEQASGMTNKLTAMEDEGRGASCVGSYPS